MDSLAELHEFAVPADIVHREIQVLKDQTDEPIPNAAGSGTEFGFAQCAIPRSLEKRVKVGLIVNEVISSASLKADPEKVEAKLEELAAISYGEPDQVIEWYRGNPEQMSNIEMLVLEDQVVDHILSAANIEEVLANYADVISGAATAQPQEDATQKAMETPHLAEEMMKAWIHKPLMVPWGMMSPSNKTV